MKPIEILILIFLFCLAIIFFPRNPDKEQIIASFEFWDYNCPARNK